MVTKNTTLAAIIFTYGLFAFNCANASIPGPYVTADVGYGFLHQTKVPQIETTSSKATGLAGRGDVGFQIDNNFSIEAGYTKYSNSNIKGNSRIFSVGNNTINSYSIDMLARFSTALTTGFNFYVKVGPAFLKESSVFTGTYSAAAGPQLAGTQFSATDVENKIFPEAGIGAMLELNTNASIDITWMHIQHIGDNNLRNADFAGVGFTYNLG